MIRRVKEIALWNEEISRDWGDFTVWRNMQFEPDRFRAALGTFYQNLLLAAADGRRFVEKTPGWNLAQLDLLTEMLPHAHYVLVYRDGRNQVASLEAARHWKGASFEFKAACRKWARTMDIVERYRDDPSRADAFVVRYEDMVDDFARVFEALCMFVDIAPFEPKAIRPNSSFPGFVAGDVFNRRWKGWRPEKKEIFKREAGRQLIDWGYVEDNDAW